MDVRAALRAKRLVGRLHDGNALKRIVGWEKESLGNLEQLEGGVAAEVHCASELLVKFSERSGVLQIEQFAVCHGKFNSGICSGIVPLRTLEGWGDLGGRREAGGLISRSVVVRSRCDAKGDGVSTVFDPRNHVELLRHGEVLTESNHVLELVQIVARGGDGSLLGEVMAARQAKFCCDFDTCLARGTIHAAHAK